MDYESWLKNDPLAQTLVLISSNPELESVYRTSCNKGNETNEKIVTKSTWNTVLKSAEEHQLGSVLVQTLQIALKKQLPFSAVEGMLDLLEILYPGICSSSEAKKIIKTHFKSVIVKLPNSLHVVGNGPQSDGDDYCPPEIRAAKIFLTCKETICKDACDSGTSIVVDLKEERDVEVMAVDIPESVQPQTGAVNGISNVSALMENCQYDQSPCTVQIEDNETRTTSTSQQTPESFPPSSTSSVLRPGSSSVMEDPIGVSRVVHSPISMQTSSSNTPQYHDHRKSKYHITRGAAIADVYDPVRLKEIVAREKTWQRAVIAVMKVIFHPDELNNTSISGRPSFGSTAKQPLNPDKVWTIINEVSQHFIDVTPVMIKGTIAAKLRAIKKGGNTEFLD